MICQRISRENSELPESPGEAWYVPGSLSQREGPKEKQTAEGKRLNERLETDSAEASQRRNPRYGR